MRDQKILAQNLILLFFYSTVFTSLSLLESGHSRQSMFTFLMGVAVFLQVMTNIVTGISKHTSQWKEADYYFAAISILVIGPQTCMLVTLKI